MRRAFYLMPSLWLSVFMVPGLNACGVTTPAPSSDIVIPANWRYHSTISANANATDDAEWWRRFGSAELNSLIQRAQTANLDVQAAQMRLRQANALVRVAGAALYPEVEGNLTAGRESSLQGNPSEDEAAGNYFALGLAASYELDLWGTNRARKMAAKANYDASRYDLVAVRLSVTSAVASAWLQVAGARERLAISRLNLDNAQRVLATVESRHRYGAAMPLELAQQRSLVAGQKHDVAELQQQANDSETALAVLLGTPVEALHVEINSLRDLRWPSIDAGVPSDLLARRPDVAGAEAQLHAASANFSAARAAQWPAVTLGIGIEAVSDLWSRLFDTQLYQLAGTLTAPLFNGGRLRAQRDVAEAQMLELLANYRNSMVAALNDVDAGLNTIAGLDARLDAQNEQLQQAQLAFDYAESRYRAGADTLLVLLDAQRTLYAAQNSNVRIRQARLQATVAIYKALGGGWRQS